MNKAELKSLYGNYMDTDKLVDDISRLLTKYRHKNSEEGICEILNTFFLNKQSLIKLFKQSENYIGDLRIAFDIEMVRDTSQNDIYYFCGAFPNSVDAKKAILEYKDEDGKTLQDYMYTGIKSLTARDLMDDNIMGKLKVSSEKKSRFMIIDGRTVASNAKFDNFCSIMREFMRHYTPTLGSDMSNRLEQYKINGKNGKFAPTLKTSRAFNRVCTHFGIDKMPKYNKLFAQYSDMVSDTKRTMKFYISLNPLDYLTMSFGNSWASCHTIDKTNRRGMPNSYSGAYCGGTLSYMLDTTSFITFVHTHTPDDIVEEGKIYRNMFHYGHDKLVQGRIYPQGNDGNTDLYKVFRGYVQKELSSLLGIGNNWVKSSRRPGDMVYSYGAHYRDYENFSYCNISYPKEKEWNEIYIKIGHEGICPNCGEEVNYHDRLNCYC